MCTLCIHNNKNSMGPQRSAFIKNSQNVLATTKQHLANQTQHQQNGGHFFARSSTTQIYLTKCTCLVVIIIIFLKCMFINNCRLYLCCSTLATPYHQVLHGQAQSLLSFLCWHFEKFLFVCVCCKRLS